MDFPEDNKQRAIADRPCWS